MKIFNAIVALLKWQNKCSISQIAKIAEVKQSKVLEVINYNSELLCKDSKGNIIGFTNKLQYVNPDELWYYTSDINYGADKQIQCNKPELIADLIKDYWEGGFGDCSKIQIVLYNQSNIAEVEKRGFIPSFKRKVMPIKDCWKENNIV